MASSPSAEEAAADGGSAADAQIGLIPSISTVASRPRLMVFLASDDDDSLSTRLAFPSPSALFVVQNIIWY
jgi:hypothetical protein